MCQTAAAIQRRLQKGSEFFLAKSKTVLRDDLNLPASEIPPVPTICRTLTSLDLTRHKASKVPLERLTPPLCLEAGCAVDLSQFVETLALQAETKKECPKPGR